MSNIEIDKKKPGQRNTSAFNGAFVFLYIFIFALAVGLDQITKHLVFVNNSTSKINLFHSYLGVQAFKNYYFAFSLPVPTVLMYAIYLFILILIGRYLISNFKNINHASWIAWVLIIAGALSNVIERSILGYVRDFIYIFTGIFNLADFYIILGVVILLAQQAKLSNEKY